MTPEEVEKSGFELVWDLKDPIKSTDTKLIKHPDEGYTVYRIRFIENGKPCANVGETAKGIGTRLRKHIGNRDPNFIPQVRMWAALKANQELTVETLSRTKS